MYERAIAVGFFASVVVALTNPGFFRGIPIVRRIMPDIIPEPIPLLDIVNNNEQQQQFTNIHLVVLIHGIFGSPLEMGHLQDYLIQHSDGGAIEENNNPANDHTFVVHSTGCNEGRTHDGLAAGGTRIADEINIWLAATRAQLLASNKKSRISLSIVGNSLGGLYARYALSKIHWKDPGTGETILHPEIFCTTVTPHLGVSGPHTYAPVGRVLEFAIANALGVTGQDLFRFTPILQDMSVNASFIEPLSQFRRRIAYANAYYTDFQVPGSTAAFLGLSAGALHRVVDSPPPASDDVSIILSVATDITKPKMLHDDSTTTIPATKEEDDAAADDEVTMVRTESSEDVTETKEDAGGVLSADALAARLDSLGWTKHFVDLRRTLVTVPNPFAAKENEKEASSVPEDPGAAGRQYYTSGELWRMYTRFTAEKGWHVPLGHTMLLANKKDAVNERMNAAGKPLMRQLAGILVDEIRSPTE